MSQEASCRVSVVVPCLNEAAAIGQFLLSVFAQKDVIGGYEVIVADGRSRDGTRELLDAVSLSHPQLRVLDNPEGTVSVGLNLAIVAARGQIIVRMDVHTTYAENYIAECVRALETTGAQNVGGAARTHSQSYFQHANAAAYSSWFSVGGAKFHDPEYEGFVDTITYGCWYRSTLMDLGMFDETLVRNQDDELNLRLTSRGGKIWQSRAVHSWYSPRSNLGSLLKQYFQYGYWKVLVIRKHGRPASIRHLVPAVCLVTGTLLLVGGLLERSAWTLLLILTLLYLTLSAMASVQAAVRVRRVTILPILPIVFAGYHGAYGAGFLWGALQHLFGRPAGGATTTLSR